MDAYKLITPAEPRELCMACSHRGLTKLATRASLLLLMGAIAGIVCLVAAAGAGATALLRSHGGPVETKPHVYEIYWGSGWNSGTPATERGKLEAMYGEISNNAWQGILTQHWGPELSGEKTAFSFISKEVPHGTPYVDTAHPVPSEVNTAKLNTEIGEAIKANKLAGWPQEPTVNDQFVVFTQPGTSFSSEINISDCGEHPSASAGYDANVPYVFDLIPWGHESPRNCSMTGTASHEFAESATDPYGNGWRDWTTGGEIADVCGYIELGEGTLSGVEVAALWDDLKEPFEGCSLGHGSPRQAAPAILTNEATGVTSSSATLNGSVELNNLIPGGYYIEWGTYQPFEPYERLQHRVNVEHGTGSPIPLEVSVSGLAAGTTYYYRVVVEDAGANPFEESKEYEQLGSVKEFRTLGPPGATTEVASNIKAFEAQLNGTVNPAGYETKYYFEYGTTTAYGTKTSEVSVGPGTTGVKVSKLINGLKASTLYHFRLVAINVKGTTDGEDITLTTLPPPSPTVTTKPATNITETGATLNGTVNPNSTETKYFFEYGTTASYGLHTTEVTAGSGTSTLEVAQSISGLTKNTTYHFRIVASNAGGTKTGIDQTFTTHGWLLQEGVNTGGTKGSVFNDVACASSSNCDAVGSYSSGTKTGSLIESWNGSIWSDHSSVENGDELTDVSCSSTSACSAVGRSIAFRWNGLVWTQQSIVIPAKAEEVVLEGVSCTSSTNCVAAGHYRKEGSVVSTLIEVWNGTSWSQQTTPNPSGTQVELADVSCVSSTACEAVGSYRNGAGKTVTLAERWNGTEWTIQTPLNPGTEESRLLGVSCTSSSACTAVGYYWVSFKTHPLVERWNGTEWKEQTAKEINSSSTDLFDVSCTSSSACTAVGRHAIPNLGDDPGIEVWNGSEWSVEEAVNPPGTGTPYSVLTGIVCLSGSSCTAVGFYRLTNEGVSGPNYTLVERGI